MAEHGEAIARQVRDALLSGDLFLEYLPIVDLQNFNRCIGAEALVRWRRAGQVVMPMEFVPAIEGTPVAGLLTYWVIDTVEAELGEWLRSHPQAHLSINVPPEILGRGGLEYAARRSHLIDVRAQIVLEITERGIPDALGIEELRELETDSVQIALDDVGVDDNNLLVLFQAPVDIIKLDKRVADEIEAMTANPSIRGILSLVRASHRTVIAEGVERVEQADMLRDAGVSWAQGWLYSRSIPADDFIRWHAEHAG